MSTKNTNHICRLDTYDPINDRSSTSLLIRFSVTTTVTLRQHIHPQKDIKATKTTRKDHSFKI